MPKPAPYISKSKYLSGLQCRKLLWYQYNAKEKIPPPDASTQALFDQGHIVGQFAKALFPGGIEVAKGIYEIPKVVKETQAVVGDRKVLYEAGFVYRNAFARVDILEPVERKRWDIIEVKSSTQVKVENLHDLAIQRYAYEGSGISIRDCFVLHINREYVRKGAIEPRKLFELERVTDEVNELLPAVEPNLEEMERVIKSRKAPEVPIGPHCDAPYACPLHEMCWDFLPDQNVFTLYRGGTKIFDLFSKGITHVWDIPPDVPLTEIQTIQRDAVRSRRPHIDAQSITSFLEGLTFPLYFLDFETFMTAIPLFDDVRPYQQVPFQYSLHVLKSIREAPEHFGYLSDAKSDPRPEILGRLQRDLGSNGSIVAYNAPFEIGRLSEATEVYREYSAWWKKTKVRFVDLLAPFRSFSYYHPDQCGSASIKAVLPALTGITYDDLEIGDGATASQEFLRISFGEVAEPERLKVRKQLEKYCKLDTRGMIEIIKRLGDLCDE